MDIKKLEFINVRDIWKSEPRHFTKWLAENIDFLNDKLDITLNVIETEKQIGSFNVDIYCEDEQGNSAIIENQLEKTDHTHLGQILTYTVGTAAKTVIWISPEPRVEHIEVFEWLNEVTPVDSSWFLYKIEVLKVNDTTVSPLFTKVVGPSQEVKNLGSEKKRIAERHQKRRKFWEALLEKLNEKTNIYSNVNPTDDNWLNAGTGVGGVYYSIIVRKESSSIQLVIDKSNIELNKKIFEYLFEFREEIEKEFGEKIIWRKMEQKKSSRIQVDINDCSLDTETWENGLDQITNKFLIWDNVFSPFIKKISTQIWE
ncbi:DUF4268 domain-containing protein [Neobacillus sp. LXY-1]|uniref:DUF4268 domain-containing protein n=1 Tax=Neobacillus sp. LXY-1 TaxID=3379133 RepID=UPI003EE40770